jgi:hypothetical protein
MTKPESVWTTTGVPEGNLAARATASSSTVLLLTGSAPSLQTLKPVNQKGGSRDRAQPLIGWGETRAYPIESPLSDPSVNISIAAG